MENMTTINVFTQAAETGAVEAVRHEQQHDWQERQLREGGIVGP